MLFDTLREANIIRLPQFKNRQGGPAHSEPDGSDWTLNDWGVAVGGEAGELLSKLKALKRGDEPLSTMLPKLAEEIADIVIYLDLLSMRLGLNMGDEVRKKFNVVSHRVDADVFIADDGKNLVRKSS